MTLMRWDPFNSLFGVKRNLDRIFGEYDDDDSSVSSFWRPAVDIFETKDSLVLRAELPGLTRDDVKISVENNVLTLRGERHLDSEVKRENYHRVERAYGTFHRSFTLPSQVDRNRIEARFENGVLEVTMPRSEDAKSREIEITAE